MGIVCRFSPGGLAPPGAFGAPGGGPFRRGRGGACRGPAAVRGARAGALLHVGDLSWRCPVPRPCPLAAAGTPESAGSRSPA
ncbi:MAG: hypothetical protein FJ291_09590 [Planctomycetes bacterium]|nr:hypothetical protein [Planctomycetota bacterium]